MKSYTLTLTEAELETLLQALAEAEDSATVDMDEPDEELSEFGAQRRERYLEASAKLHKLSLCQHTNLNQTAGTGATCLDCGTKEWAEAEA